MEWLQCGLLRASDYWTLRLPWAHVTIDGTRPGTSGKIRLVALSGAGRDCYVELGTEAIAHLDAVTNAVVWTA